MTIVSHNTLHSYSFAAPTTTTTKTMAEAATLTNQISATKLVQEIVKKGDHVPEQFLYKDGLPEAIDVPDLWTNDLLIDMSLLSSSTSELAKLRSALSQWGCCQIINHGIECSFLEELIELGKQFFALPLEEKLKCSAENDVVEGYGSDAFYSGNQIPNWNDRLFLTVYPKERIKHQCWPQKPEKLGVMIHEFCQKLKEVNKVMCKAMARSLNIDENSLNFGKEGPTLARLNFYPRCSCPQQVLGTKPHSDSSWMTYLLPQKEVEGLQILKDEQWYKVLAIPNALVLHMGDLGEVITNGVFKSVTHRVSTNNMNERISVGMFVFPDNDEEVFEPLSELISAEQPQLYRKFKLSEFQPKIFESYQLGIKPLDPFRV